ncbi:MAG: pyruvate formate lyase-activating protein [Mycoplasmataceae bacterium]|jgi:pyruvate formate lyase activating enzyme|nr:pyruvate formate lyase-activating protein [Mycoplasmataceae bacterium]
MVSAPCFKIETFGAVDGPSIRLVFFLQGCPLRCLYCHNPESWKFKKEKLISVEEVINLYQKNKSFYKNGGITLSGGEPLIHQEFCLELAKQCYLNKISLALDTSGVTFNERFFKKLIKYKPLFLIDIKHINKNKHQMICGVKEQRELSLIKFLEKNHLYYWVRQVIIPTLTDNKDDLFLLKKFIKKLKYLKRFELLPYHKLGVKKYQQLKIKYLLKNIKEPTKSYMSKLIKYFNV